MSINIIDIIDNIYYYIYMLKLKNIFKNEHFNMDEVIQLIHINNPNCISIQLLKEDRITEMYYLIQLTGILSIYFQDNIRNYNIIFGSYFSHQPVANKIKAIDNSNKSLQYLLEKIEKHKIKFIGEIRKFNKKELLPNSSKSEVL
jgi:hypothetical protein